MLQRNSHVCGHTDKNTISCFAQVLKNVLPFRLVSCKILIYEVCSIREYIMGQGFKSYFFNEHEHYSNEINAHRLEETWFLNAEEDKQRCSLVSQSAGAHLCSWAISWLRSSSSLLPVSSADTVELLLSWGERHRRCEEEVVRKYSAAG